MAAKNLVYVFLITFVYNIFRANSILPTSYRVTSSEAPFMVYISNRHHYCGGAIVTEYIVLTASHCVFDNDMMVIAGTSTKYYDNNTQIINVQRSLQHDNYLIDPNGVQAYNDIALLLLRTPFTFNAYVQPIEWTKHVDFEKEVQVYGWGSTDAFRNNPSNYLRAKNVSLISDKLCIEMLSKATTKCTKQVYELCAEKSACRGDSGGPATQTVENVTKLIGVASWLADDNINCDTAPAVFEDVGYFSDWIKDGIRFLMKANVTKKVSVHENAV